MKYLCIVTLVALISVLTAHAAENEKHLFILSGQSNMDKLDPDISFTPTVEAAFGNENVTIVKDALGGQPIRRWYKKWKPLQGDEPKATGDLYDRLMKKVSAVVTGKEFTTITFVWMQGERDAKESHGEVYAASLKGLINQLSRDLCREDINFVIGRLSDFDMDNARYPHWTMVREAQVEVAASNPRYQNAPVGAPHMGRWFDSMIDYYRSAEDVRLCPVTTRLANPDMDPSVWSRHLEYSLDVAKQCGLTKDDMFIPKPYGKKPIQTKKTR